MGHPILDLPLRDLPLRDLKAILRVLKVIENANENANKNAKKNAKKKIKDLYAGNKCAVHVIRVAWQLYNGTFDKGTITRGVTRCGGPFKAKQCQQCHDAVISLESIREQFPVLSCVDFYKLCVVVAEGIGGTDVPREDKPEPPVEDRLPDPTKAIIMGDKGDHMMDLMNMGTEICRRASKSSKLYKAVKESLLDLCIRLETIEMLPEHTHQNLMKTDTVNPILDTFDQKLRSNGEDPAHNTE